VDELLLKQLVRQLKIMNFWISMFGTMILVVLIILGALVWKVVSFVNDTNKKIETLTSQTKETLDVKSKLCDSEKLGNLLTDRTSLCK
jgi:cytoskeletal protein RodZ